MKKIETPLSRAKRIASTDLLACPHCRKKPMFSGDRIWHYCWGNLVLIGVNVKTKDPAKQMFAQKRFWNRWVNQANAPAETVGKQGDKHDGP